MNNAFIQGIQNTCTHRVEPTPLHTLARGTLGTRRLHQRTLEALRLGKCNQTVMRWNTPTVHGMLQQVKRLAVIETEEMFKAHKKGLEEHRALRSPIVVNHPAASQ